MDHYSYGLALAAGIGSAALGYAGKRLYQYRKNRHNPQSLGIKVTRLQKQDTTEKKKKEKVKEKQNEYLFDVKQYLASFKEGTTTTSTAQVSDESSTISAGGGVLARFEGKKQRSARILLTEFENLVETPIPNIGLLPEKNNLFVWHCNIIPQYGASKGAVFHFIIRIPDEYPENAPTAENCTPSAGYLYPFSSWDTTMSLSTEMQRIEQQLNVLTMDLTAQTKAVILPKVHHDSNKQAWPPVPKSGLLTMLTAKEDTFAEKKKKQLVCFYTKQNHEQAKLGLGITFNKNIRTGELQQIRCTQHLVSLKAFNRYKIRNIDRMNCTHWLPVYICPSHAPMRLVERAISLICTGTSDSFEPDQVLKVLPKLMNNLLVETATGVLPGVTGLRLYCLIHRLLLALNEQYPAIGKKATQFISDFIHNDAARHKNVTPNLGELIAMLSITDLTWSDLKGAYYRESSVRNAYWIIKTHPQLDPEYKEKMRKKRLEELKEMKDDSSSIHEFEDEEEEEEITEEERIEKSFAVTRVGKQILAFQIFIQQNIAQPSNITRQQIAKQYDDFFGAPVDNIETAFIEEIAFIKGNNFRTDDYLAAIAMPILSDEDLAAQLIRDMHESKKKGYHGEIILNTIIKPEEFAKLNRIDLKKFFEIENYELVLHSDEAKWKQEAEQRWGIQSIVEHCSSWRETYLCNHLRDVVEGLNDSLDFDYVYSTAEQCNNYITFLELELFNPTNLKSRYFFLAKVLDKLNNLKTFKLLKGADELDPKAFKALCMGLNRCKKLSTLILDNCKLTANDLQYLLTNDLVSDSITKLKLSGNHIGNDGVVLIAKFLGNHKTLPNLEELSLNGCKINTVSPLADSLIFKTKLKVVELKNNAMGGETSALLKKAAYCTSLESINVAGTSAYIDSMSLTTNLTITSALKTLVLYKALSISLDSNFVKAFGGNTTLTTLDLGCSGISSMPHLGQALAANKSLKTLILQSCRISAEGLCLLVENIKDKGGLTLIEELDLSENLMYPTAILEENRKFSKKERSEFDILGELLSVAPNLKSLNLGSCSLHYKSLVKFSEVLESHDSLHKLDLKKNKYIARSIHHLVNALKKNTVLEVLDISGSNIGASGAISISEAVLHNVALKNLSIYGNFIGPDGCCGILEALRKNPKSSLKELDMGLNRIKARGVKLLIDLINDEKYTFPLTYIGLKDDHINDIMALRLVSSIVKTKNLTNKIEMITLHGNKLRGTTINQIASDLSVANIKFDLSKLVEAKQQDKQQRTVYLPSLSMSITPEAIKRMFYKSYCGAIISVDIHPHKRRGDFASAKYAFVEFAEQESVSIAMTLAGNKKNTIGSNIIRIYRAGITQN